MVVIGDSVWHVGGRWWVIEVLEAVDPL